MGRDKREKKKFYAFLHGRKECWNVFLLKCWNAEKCISVCLIGGYGGCAVGTFWMLFSVFVLKLVLLSCKVVQLQFQFALLILWALLSSFWSFFLTASCLVRRKQGMHTPTRSGPRQHVCHGFHVESHVEPNVEGYTAFGWLFWSHNRCGSPIVVCCLW